MTPTQTEPFIPLTPSTFRRGDAVEHRAQVVSQPAQTQSFKPLAAELSSAPKSASTHTNKGCDPRVSIQREGDQVTGIRIQCSCGQVIELACIY